MIAALPTLFGVVVYGTTQQSGDISSPSYLAEPSNSPLVAEGNTAKETASIEPLARASPTALCKREPVSGKVLTGNRRLIRKGHILEIVNGSIGNSIVKLRDATSQKAMASFFVKSGDTATLTGIPDGTYVIQYAFGPALAKNCTSFTIIESAGQFPQLETLTTERIEDYSGTKIRRMRLSYTLYSVPGGNVRPEDITASAFSTD